MPEAAPAALSLDRAVLERILEPWSADGDGPALVIEDLAGGTLAGARLAPPVGGSDERFAADIVVDGVVVARVVATDGGSGGPGPNGAVRSLALAIGALATEARARDAAQRALVELRTTVAAETLGTDPVELAKGRRQQRSILSLDAPEVTGYDLASHYAAAREIGGDFFELFRLPRRGHPLGMVVADVTGKGLDAALLMAFSRPVMHSALNAARGPADALTRTNRVLVGERRGTLFITALCAVLDARSGRLRIASAGHEPPLLVPADGGPIRAVGEAGVLMGAFATIDPPEVETTLQPGEVLFAYTDGVTDALGPGRARFGDARLLATLEAARGGSAGDVIEAVRTAVERFQGAEEPADDLTMVAIGRRRTGRRPR